MGQVVSNNIEPNKTANGLKASGNKTDGQVKATSRPSAVQLRYLKRGTGQAGGKLPLFDENGQQYTSQTIKACIVNGWAEPWFNNPAKPDWLVCKLTELGHKLAK